jgi:hypothetical protein
LTGLMYVKDGWIFRWINENVTRYEDINACLLTFDHKFCNIRVVNNGSLAARLFFSLKWVILERFRRHIPK